MPLFDYLSWLEMSKIMKASKKQAEEKLIFFSSKIFFIDITKNFSN